MIVRMSCLLGCLSLSLSLSLFAKSPYSELKSADGSRIISAMPIAVEGKKIQFEKENGEMFLAGLGFFAEADQKNLKAWMAAASKFPHAAVVDRVKKAKTLRVLFVGNSYSFQIPKVFATLAKEEGKSVEVRQATNGGWTLAKHAATHATLDYIATGKWDIVVLQEQSLVPSFPEGQRGPLMDAPAKALASAVRDAGAIPVFFLTWGRRDGDKINAKTFPNDTYEAMQKRLGIGYRKAAKQAGGAYLVPVGEIWKMTRTLGKDEGLYTKDGSHPGKRGNYLAACVFFSAFYNAQVSQKSEGIDGWEGLAASAATARLVRRPYP